jgi:hypothetical protein
MRARTPQRIAVSVVGFGVLFASLPRAGAQPPGRDLCLAPYDQGQELRRQGRLRAARDVFRACARETCPEAARVDCTQWGAEVAATLPTVVIQARDASGQDVTGLRVEVDGERIADYEEGRPFEIDPGPHTLRFEARGQSTELRIVAREGEKGRVVAVAFSQSAGPRAEPSAPPARSASRPIPAAAWAFAGVGVVGAGAFATLGAIGFAKHGALRQSCADHCTDDQVRPIRVDYAVGDISLAVSLASFGVATLLFLTRPASRSERSATAFIAPRGAGVGGTF